MNDSPAPVIPRQKLPQTDAALITPIRHRWSPRGFLDKSVPVEVLRTVLEAARWAASSSNEQPWRYIVARREQPEEFSKLLSVLVEKNQLWAKGAPVLILSVAKRTTTSGRQNRHSLHDTGAASATLSIQAAELGLQIHQMGGFDQNKAREVFGIPEDFEPVAAMALGYPGTPETAPEDFRAGETSPRMRKPLSELAFSSKCGAKRCLHFGEKEGNRLRAL